MPAEAGKIEETNKRRMKEFMWLTCKVLENKFLGGVWDVIFVNIIKLRSENHKKPEKNQKIFDIFDFFLSVRIEIR